MNFTVNNARMVLSCICVIVGMWQLLAGGLHLVYIALFAAWTVKPFAHYERKAVANHEV